jgi:hypothetical protein
MKSGNTSTPTPLPEGIALLAAYLLSSGRRQLEESPDYAVYRLIEGARRALELLETCGGLNPDLISVRTCLDGIVHGPPAQRDFAVLLDDLCRQMVNGLKYSDTTIELTGTVT